MVEKEHIPAKLTTHVYFDVAVGTGGPDCRVKKSEAVGVLVLEFQKALEEYMNGEDDYMLDFVTIRSAVPGTETSRIVDDAFAEAMIASD